MSRGEKETDTDSEASKTAQQAKAFAVQARQPKFNRGHP